MKLAEQMGCGLSEVKERITQYELVGWLAYWDLKAEAERAAAEAAKEQGKNGRRGNKPPIKRTGRGR